MTRPEAFALARQRVQETGKPWLVTHRRPFPRDDRPNRFRSNYYEVQSALETLSSVRGIAAWLSVNGSVRVYDGLGVPEGTPDPTPEERKR